MLHRLAIALLAIAAIACGRSSSGPAPSGHKLPDTLRVATLYSPVSYFIYRDEKMGYDYSLVSELAQEKGMALDLKVATSLNNALAMLDSGLVDLVAYDVPVTSEYKERVIACGPEFESYQVLVQPKHSDQKITDVTELVGRDVYVVEGSHYQQRLENLNDELGGGINIHTVNRDTLVTEDLIAMVQSGELPLTVVDSEIAKINQTYYPALDINLEVSFPQRLQWAVAKGNQWLADSINAWFASDEPREKNAELLKQYFEQTKEMPPVAGIDLSDGRISKYDELFRNYAKDIGWDWRLLASQAFVESRYNPRAVSWAGARGLMQVMPSTARGYKVNPQTLFNPETSVQVATKLISSLDRSLASRVPDPDERLKFIIASYNGGLAHILDAIALAKKTGKNPQVWDGNVADALMLKSNPEYFNDPVVKYGYFRGRETTNYVKQVMDFYHKVSAQVKA